MEYDVVHMVKMSPKLLDHALGYHCNIATVALEGNNVGVLDIFSTELVLFYAGLEVTTVAEILALDAARSHKESREGKGEADLERVEHLGGVLQEIVQW